jgi:sugar lactone lactonase YvrE
MKPIVPIEPEDLRIVVPAGNLIGESPLWSVREQALYWVDVEGRLVQRWMSANGELNRWAMPEVTSSIGLRRGGGLVAATRTGFVFLDTGTGTVTPIVNPEADLPENRFNDGKVDRRGRFWAGTKNIANTPEPTGSVYRLDPDRTSHRIEDGISCTNGIAWSADNSAMYICDTWIRRIYRYAFDAKAGIASHRAVFAELTVEEGYPDGLTVDAEGFVWSAHYNGWRISRYAPDGRLERTIRMPVQHVTSLMFGGPDLRTLFVTSASMRLPADAAERQPEAGHVFAFDAGVAGLPEPEFLG